jgi:hypothetical protein
VALFNVLQQEVRGPSAAENCARSMDAQSTVTLRCRRYISNCNGIFYLSTAAPRAHVRMS